MARYRLIVSYDGTDFCGWQRQKSHAHASPLPSIQQTLETALTRVLNHPVSLSASGRTDAGVHAVAQVCHFDTDRKLPRDLCWALKSQLPPSISVKDCQPVPAYFHATLSATRKTYRYWIWNHPRAPALLCRYSWWIRRPLDLALLNQLTEPLVGEHDFASFRSEGTPVRHTVRKIHRAVWRQRREGIIEFSVTGNGFLKQMVRNLVGTLVTLSWNDPNPEKIKQIMKLKDRTKAGMAAPPQGLFLLHVVYPGTAIQVDKAKPKI
ncbi:MAG: tRNA pseudouridine(38-40) synthase TruA [Bdellovibrio sp.]|nr:MAG: tRNA pseudouridine(38-40) synthase TruA [Bdellovibrio sp.]